MSVRNELRMFLLGCGLLVAVSALALDSDKNQPMNIAADHGEFLNNTKADAGTGIYDGHVVITQGSIRITADHAVVHTLNGELKSADITGQPATFQQQPDKGELMHGVADKIHYNADTNQVDMIGHADMQQGLRHLQAEVIHYNTESEHMIADGGKNAGRVHITIPPKQPANKPPKGGTS